MSRLSSEEMLCSTGDSLSPSLLFPLILLLALFFCLVKMKENTVKEKMVIGGNLPPSPPKLPIIGNLHQLGRLPIQKLWELSQKYGPCVLLKLGSIPTLVISSADFAKQVLKNHDISFCSRPRSPGPKKIFYGSLDVAFSPYGDHWHETRKIFVCHLLSSKRAESFSSAREREIIDLIDYLSLTSPKQVHLDEKIFNLGYWWGWIFGKSYRGRQFEGQLLKDVMVEAMHMIDSFSADDFFPFLGWIVDRLLGHKARLDKCFRKLDGYLEMVPDEHFYCESRREEDDEDLVDVLIGLSNEENGLHLSKKHIKAYINGNDILSALNT